MNPRQRLNIFIKIVRGPIHPALVIFSGVLLVFALILTFNEPLLSQAAPPVESTAPTRIVTVLVSTTPRVITATLTATQQPTPTHTPLPAEYLENTEQSVGIIAGTIMLVILVIGGTLGGAFARRREKK